MGPSRNPSSQSCSTALQHLFQYIDELNPPLHSAPSLDHLLPYTHNLSHTLSNTLNNLVRATGGCDEKSLEFVRLAIDEAAESITTARGLMLELYHLRAVSAEIQKRVMDADQEAMIKEVALWSTRY